MDSTRKWPHCMFDEGISDSTRQEMSREKLLSKFLMSIQAFTYSCCCEGFDARRAYRRSLTSAVDATRLRRDANAESVFSRYGMSGVECDGHLIVLPLPSSHEDGGLQPFDGRLGKLRYLGLAVMSAAGAVSTDIVQLILSFPTDLEFSTRCQNEQPDRAPIAYPLLLGHIMTHIVTAIFATCGRARAVGDSIDMWQVPLLNRGGFELTKPQSGSTRVDGVIDDCEGFLKLGLLARMLQVLLGKMQIPPAGISNAEAFLVSLRNTCDLSQATSTTIEYNWTCSCLTLLEVALSPDQQHGGGTSLRPPEPKDFLSACALASDAACCFVSELSTILQVLVPGIMARHDNCGKEHRPSNEGGIPSSYVTFEKLRSFLEIEPVGEMLESTLVRQVVANWYSSSCNYANNAATSPLRQRLRRTHGFRPYDWPSAGVDVKRGKDSGKHAVHEQPHDDSATRSSQMERTQTPRSFTSNADILRGESTPVLVTFSSKKSVPLLGGFTPEGVMNAGESLRPRVIVIPTSYTDLYAELGALMPDCEQTAVCLICGEVLNAGGKGECTRHSYKCGAGAGMFFLLQECSGLIMHKSKAAYIHSPYVDSHGETPQYRGRPLNLDLDRYDHLREVWFGHGVRQQVVAERGSSRQVILPDFY
jgi:hypothetical protein